MKKNKFAICCIMWTGKNLSDSAREALFQAACDCVRDKKNERKVFHDDVRGIVYTEFDYSFTGSIHGVLFEGNIETEEGRTRVKYIVPENDLEEIRKEDPRWRNLTKKLKKKYE